MYQGVAADSSIAMILTRLRRQEHVLLLGAQLKSLLEWLIKDTKREEPIMARVELNTRAPGFTLLDFSGNSVSLSDFADRKNVLVVFNRGFL